MHVIVKGIDYVQAYAYIQLAIFIQTCYAFMRNRPTVSKLDKYYPVFCYIQTSRCFERSLI